jgi:hypothetical protein
MEARIVTEYHNICGYGKLSYFRNKNRQRKHEYLLLYQQFVSYGSAIAQAVRRWLLAAETRVQFIVS